MKIGIDMGHTLSGDDYGAVGVKAESNLTREVGNLVISKLQALGHTVINCTKDSANSVRDSLNYRTNMANNNNVDIFVSIHFNCFNAKAHGTEVFTYGGRELPQARAVLNNICALGYTNRGIKDGSKLKVINGTKAKSMLIECCFCDSKEDMSKYNADKMANAIVKGLVGQTVSTSITTPVQETAPQTRELATWEVNVQGDIIRRLQAELNKQFGAEIKVDGYAGDATVSKLITVRPGATGNITKIIQELLIRKDYNVAHGADGIFGSGTKQAVMDLQRKYGLSTDGIVGPNTWKALLRK